MTIEEIESACDRSQSLDFSRHALQAPELTLRKTFYPLGFPTALRTNSAEIMAQAHELWSIFEKRFDTKLIRVDVHVQEAHAKRGSGECPPEPIFRMILPLLINVADSENYSITVLERSTTQIVLTRATEKYRSYLGYFFLGSAPLSHIATRHATPVHAACVAFHGHGILLCGDSGAGKSSLSYACARAGWTYVTDDASYLLNGGKHRLVTGNCHNIRFRPSAAELFPEVNGLEITSRATGKPSIEMPTVSFPQIICAQTAQVDFVVFLNRRTKVVPALVSYRRDVARYFLRQVLYGSVESLAVQNEALERLLTAKIFELRYSNLDCAVHLLKELVRERR